MLSPVLIVTLSMATGAIGTTLCSHMNGNRESCHAEKTKAPSQAQLVPDTTTETSQPVHSCMHAEMSAMASDGMATPDVQEADMTSASEESVGENDFNGAAASNPSLIVIEVGSFSQPEEGCTHCMMHSQNIPAESLRTALPTGASHEFAAAENAAAQIKSPAPRVSILDLHDHGPPGPSSARHLLINVFRI